MHYNFELEIPSLTSEENKFSKVVKVDYGILRHISIFFPWGCADNVRVQIYRFERQIFPSNPGASYLDNDYHIEIEEYFAILEKPYELRLIGWNIDDRFDHIVYFRLLILEPTTIGRPELRPTTEEELTELLGTYYLGGGE